jgi:hypothetical protein
MIWQRVTKFDKRAVALADKHYSRRKPGSAQFMPPGETIVLLSADERAVFGWWRPHPSSGIKAMNGLDGWTCTIFRNAGCQLAQSSDLIIAAESFVLGCGPDGYITYVWDKKVATYKQPKRPIGYCFKKAGYRVAGRSADGKKTLMLKQPGSDLA